MKQSLTSGQYSHDAGHSYRHTLIPIREQEDLARIPPPVFERLWESKLCREKTYCWRCTYRYECKNNLAVRRVK